MHEISYTSMDARKLISSPTVLFISSKDSYITHIRGVSYRWEFSLSRLRDTLNTHESLLLSRSHISQYLVHAHGRPKIKLNPYRVLYIFKGLIYNPHPRGLIPLGVSLSRLRHTLNTLECLLLSRSHISQYLVHVHGCKKIYLNPYHVLYLLRFYI
jgi:hypothetical protein